jgi:N-acetylmuramic acid 6-phosphate etherase
VTGQPGTPPAVRGTSPTEERNPRTARLDEVPTAELLGLLGDEDALVPAAVAAVRPQLAALVDEAVRQVRAGGRVHYFGAGSSGRLAVLDAAELPPTFGVGPGDVVVAHLAGGPGAFARAVEDAEDDEGGRDAADVTAADVVVGIAASGRTPYVAGALRAARAVGAATALVTANPRTPLAGLADHLIAPDTGPEALTGSTRLKAGTAQKLVLNGFSTALMVRLGHTYRNFMIDMRESNAKLRGRSVAMLVQASGESEQRCTEALARCRDRKTALVWLLAGGRLTPDAAAATLDRAGGVVRVALGGPPAPSWAPYREETAMTEQTPSHDRSDHMGAVRPDDPLDAGTDDEARTSADADRSAAFGEDEPTEEADGGSVRSAEADRAAAEPRD